MRVIRLSRCALLVTTVVLLAGCTQGMDPALSSRLQQLEREVATLRMQSQASQDYVAIANLQSSYGYYVDKSRWDDAADLFAADATLEIAGRGLFTGQQRIRQYLHQLGQMSYGRLYNHMQLQPVIHVAEGGQAAHGRWRAFMQVGRLGAEARWGDAIYENEYIKESGVWKIRRLHSYITFYVDFDKGWNKAGVALPQRLQGLEPDGASTVRYGAFPEVFLPPYHYLNPVTGK